MTITGYSDRHGHLYYWVVTETITPDMLEQRNVRYPRQAHFPETVYGQEAEAVARAFAADAAERGWDYALRLYPRSTSPSHP